MGRLVIDLEGIFSGTSDDIVLEGGDTITIPKEKQSISVIGEVFVSNSHIYKDTLDINDYIALSGGATSFADEANIYLIKSNGSILAPSEISPGFFRSSSSLMPGDTIVVPLQIQPFNSIRATTEITQIIYQMALAAAAVNSF
jgi:protein involved in polysaccharide export with SLBB domain